MSFFATVVIIFINSMSTQVSVINPTEGKRYKMSLKGDITRLSIRKFKKYLSASCGIAEEDQLLKYNGVELGDDVLAGEVGITAGSTLTVERYGNQSAPFVASPARHNLELETLDQQRTVLLSERLRRDEEFRRHHDVLSKSLSEAERRRRDLEREQQERQQEMDHLRDLETRADAERKRVAALRAAEAERENLRSQDIEARKAQLQAERTAQRQLEMQKLENERKKMLLAQQRAEYESEKARLEREREEYFQRRRQQELEIKEKEFALERQQIEAERARKELELEKQVLHEKRNAELSRVGLATQPHAQPKSMLASVQSTPSAGTRIPPITPRNTGPSRDTSVVVQQEDYTPQHQWQNAPLPSVPYPSQMPPQKLDVKSNMEANLASLASTVGVARLTLDDNNTCVVTYQERYTLLLTFDAATERLYLYSTLATAIPKDAERKLKLYEFLLEGALLGRDMCGGGVGASLKNDFILMATSVYLPECGPSALAIITPSFVESLGKWRARIKERGLVDPDDDASRSMLRESTQSVSSGAGYDYRSVSMAREAPFIGIEVSDGEVVNGYKHFYTTGVLVMAAKGPAQRAGFLPQDFIKTVGGKPITSLESFRAAIRDLKPKDC